MFIEKMKPAGIPERVFALCRTIGNECLSIKELHDKIEPNYWDNSTKYFSEYFKVAKELGLIIENDSLISLSEEGKNIKDITHLRIYCNIKLSNYMNGPFYQVTKAYFNQNCALPHMDSNISDAYKWLNSEYKIDVDADAMRGWRFWASFLGFGYLQNNLRLFLPNPAVFLNDIIHASNLEKKKRYTIDEFIEKLEHKCDVLIDNNLNEKKINYGTSNGLRTLHDMKVITLERIQDFDSMWMLYPLEQHPITGIITHITICK